MPDRQAITLAERLAGLFLMFHRRVSILVGHFGSGKTEIAVNCAFKLAAAGQPVSLVDLDVIKPYFRSRSARSLLEKAGVDLVAPSGDNYYADLPIIVPRVRSLCKDVSRRIIIDAGGDDTGARVLGSLSDVLDGDEADFFLVLNFRRPLTPDVESAVAMANEIQARARLQINGVVSNTHVMDLSTPAVVREGFALAVQVAARLGTKVVAVCVPVELLSEFGKDEFGVEIFPVDRVIRPSFSTGDSSLHEDGSGDVRSAASHVNGAYKVRKTGPLFAPEKGG